MASKSDYWYELGMNSVLLNAVKNWRGDAEIWFQGSFNRLPETVRVNPLRKDNGWVEDWLRGIGGKRISWFNGKGTAYFTVQMSALITMLHYNVKYAHTRFLDQATSQRCV